MNKSDLFQESNVATYCPEDDKLRLYVGRVPRGEYEALRAEGWVSTPKQDCDFVAVWTSRREDTALSYAGVILDEDQGPEDRAADRAERFSGYLDKRLAEAEGHADRYDAGPSVHGYQDKGRAVRAADRHDRIASRAVNAWDKAEYWQRRTAGVISHALYNSSPGVRMGRIKTIEKELRDLVKAQEGYTARYKTCKAILAESDPEKAFRMAYDFANLVSRGSHYHHPREESRTRHDREHGTSLYSLLTQENDPITGHEAANLWFVGSVDPESEEWHDTRTSRAIRHCQLRIAYEMQMLEGQGGRLELMEILPGGMISGALIVKVNKSPVTQRAVSVSLKVPRVDSWTYKVENCAGCDFALAQFDTERMSPESYTPPTPESLEMLAEVKKQMAAAVKKANAGKASLVNPTVADAERLVAIWNEKAQAEHAEAVRAYRSSGEFKPAKVYQIKQASYSQMAAGAHAKAEVRGVCGNGELEPRLTGMYSAGGKERARLRGPAVVKIRIGTSTGYHTPPHIIVLTDKPQKPLPASVWEPYTPPVAESAPVSADA